MPTQSVGTINVAAGSRPTQISLTPPIQTVGAGLPAMAPSQPTHISLTLPIQTVGAGLLAKAMC
ncbi:hypothetical protein BFW87_30185 [Pseudomonas fluorescens]|uniref:Uncharacterized protein n=1 Tax=Pseudomonas fluorescens TaxID=294 RepID=A0A1T2XUU9_PSEFL|nr:hypothetical protein BFW87_30185 [Pseudomonas fluorescens]